MPCRREGQRMLAAGAVGANYKTPHGLGGEKKLPVAAGMNRGLLAGERDINGRKSVPYQYLPVSTRPEKSKQGSFALYFVVFLPIL